MFRRTRLLVAPVIAFAAFVGVAAPAHAYDARVTLKDLKEANAKCVGTTCVLGGRVYDCKGGGLCTIAR